MDKTLVDDLVNSVLEASDGDDVLTKAIIRKFSGMYQDGLLDKSGEVVAAAIEEVEIQEENLLFPNIGTIEVKLFLG